MDKDAICEQKKRVAAAYLEDKDANGYQTAKVYADIYCQNLSQERQNMIH